MLGRLLGVAARRPPVVLLTLLAIAVAGGVVGALVPVDGRIDRLAPSGSSAERAGALERASFGGDTALVVVRGDMVQTLRSTDLVVLAELEACLSGTNPAAKGPCATVTKLKGVQTVLGPGRFVNSALAELQATVQQRAVAVQGVAAQAKAAAEQEAKKAGKTKAQITEAGEQASYAVMLKGYSAALEYASSLGLSANSSLVDKAFTTPVLFAKGADGKLGPKRRLAWLIPNRQTALIQVRLRGDLAPGKRAQVTEALRAVVADPRFALTASKATYAFTGVAPATQTLADAIRRSALALGAAALLVMAAVLLLARRLRRRLLPVLVAASVTGVALLALGLPAGGLSLAVVVALPVLVGLAVDQAVQAQLRLERRLHPAALRTLVIAGAAAAASALALVASPFAIVRTVAVAIAIAILLAIVMAAAASAAAIGRSKRRSVEGEPTSVPGGLLGALRDADELVAASAPVRGSIAAARKVTAIAARTSHRGALIVIGIGVLVAVGGAVLGSQTRVETDLTSLVPANSDGARQLERLRADTGSSSSVSLVVQTKNVGDPAIWRYLVATQRQVAAGGSGRCDGEGLCVPLPLDEYFRTKPTGALPTDAQVEQTLAALPGDLSRSFIDPDKGVIALPFGIGTLDGPAQRRLVERLRAVTAASPPGATTSVAGLPAVVAASAAALESTGRRAILALLAILLPAVVLLAATRSVRRTIVAIVPPAFALGWSELALWLLGVPRTPLTAALGVLVAAVAVEFSVLLAERFAALRSVGVGRQQAIVSTLRDTGGAVAISAGATIAGFAVLGLASIPLIAEFGLVTAVDLAVVLVALIAVGPATWVLADREPNADEQHAADTRRDPGPPASAAARRRPTAPAR